MCELVWCLETSASAHADTFKIHVAAWERPENGLGHLLRRHEGFGGFLESSWKRSATSREVQKWFWGGLEDDDLAILRQGFVIMVIWFSKEFRRAHFQVILTPKQ